MVDGVSPTIKAHSDLYETHALKGPGQHLLAGEERGNKRQSDRAVLCLPSSAERRAGEKPSELWRVTMTDCVEVQLQDESGNWRTMAVNVDVSAIIRARMDEVKRQFPGARVRAVDRGGRLLVIA